MELPGGPVRIQDRCFQPELEEEGVIPISTMEIDSESIEENEARSYQGSSTSDTTMAESVLVPNIVTNEPVSKANNLENESKVELNRLEIINSYRKSNGMDEELIKHLNNSTRSKTNKLYDVGWKKYTEWCIQNKCQPKAYDPQQIINFLMSCKDLQLSTLNGYRSALASVLNVIHPKKRPIGEVSDVSQYFKAKRRLTVNIPRETQLETWNLDILSKYILQHLTPTHLLNNYNLQHKTILLLCMHTMWRPRSDIGRIQFRDVLMKYDQDILEEVTIHVREPKEAQQKSS